MVEQTPRLGLWLDTSALTVEATLDRLISEMPAARISWFGDEPIGPDDDAPPSAG